MSRSFDYQSATVDAIAVRLLSVQNQAYYRLVTYYTNKQSIGMVVKLEQARKLSTILRLQSEYDDMYGAA
jgi:hypothetical protein